MAVHRAIAWIESASNPRATHQAIHELARRRSRRLHDRHRCSRPDENADVDTIRGLGEKLADGDHRGMPLHGKIRVNRPAGDVHVRASAAHRRSDRGQRGRPVDVHLQGIAIAWGRGLGPGVAVPTKSTVPADTRKEPDVMPTRRILDDFAEPAIQTAHDPADHGLLALGEAGSMTRMVAHLYAGAPY